jgi:hypothetical protein
MTDASGPGNDLLEKVFRSNDETVVSRCIAGETILVPIRGSLADMQKLFTLDSVGAFIWGKLDGKRTVREVREEVVKAFEVEDGKAEADLTEFLAALVDERLLVERK